MINQNYHKENLKDQILNLTIQVIKTENYQAVSVRRLAKELNVSPTAIYRHYDNLDNLYQQVAEIFSYEFTKYLLTQYDQKQLSSPMEELETLGYHFVKYATAAKNEFEFLFLSEHSLKDVSLATAKDVPLIKLMASVIERMNQSAAGRLDQELLFKQIWCFIFGYAVLVSQHELTLDHHLIQATIKSLITK